MYRDERQAGKPKDDQDLVARRADIQRDLKFAFKQRESLKAANRHFWQQDDGGANDLRKVWEDNREFRRLVWLPGDNSADAPPTEPSRPAEPTAAATASTQAATVPRDRPAVEPSPPAPPEPSRPARQASTDTEPER
jgi:hypothetical protein